MKPSNETGVTDSPAALPVVACSAFLGQWVVSVVMVKITGNVTNTQNKLWAVQATSREEAHGKVMAFAQADYPEHYLHTICSYNISNLSWPNAEISDGPPKI